MSFAVLATSTHAGCSIKSLVGPFASQVEADTFADGILATARMHKTAAKYKAEPLQIMAPDTPRADNGCEASEMSIFSRIGVSPIRIDLEKLSWMQRKSTRKSRAAYVETHRRLAKEINKKHWFKKWIL